MRSLDIPTRLLSEAIWKKLFEASAGQLVVKKQSLFDLMASLEHLRTAAEYDTGSISTSSIWALYSLCFYFRPRAILEIGTFIGKSTLAMATGTEDAGFPAPVHTCDQSNAIRLPVATKCQVVQYEKKSSTQMLSALSASGAIGQFELLNVDGRLQNEDFAHLAKICSPDVVVALDDFEGTEKGVINLVNLRQANIFPSHMPVYPPGSALLRDFGFLDHSTVALLLPQSALRLTAQ